MLVERQHRFNVTDYHRMAASGVFPPDARVELLNGKINDMPPTGPFHGGLVNRLTRLFGRLSNDRWLVSAQNPLHLDDHSEPQPDMMLLRPSKDDYTHRHPQPEDVFLLIEVSDSTLDYDREQKLPAYGRAGVAEVWIINLIEMTIEVYCDPHFTGYGSKATLRAGDSASPKVFPDASVEVSELLKR